MRYDKLVRDRIPDIIRKKGQAVQTHVADDAEYWKRLKEKLQEETAEFYLEETPEELADILEVLVAIAGQRGWDLREIEKIRCEKAAARGGFYARIVLEETQP